MRVTEGEIQSCVAKFFTDDGPVQPLEHGTGPLVTVIDNELNIIMDAQAIPTSNIGEWSTEIAIPILGLDDDMTATIVWVFESASGMHRLSQELIIEPQISHRVSDCVCMFMEPDQQGLTFDLVVPWHVRPTDTVDIYISLNNTPVAKYSSSDADVHVVAARSASTCYRLPIAGYPDILAPMAVNCVYTGGQLKDKRMASYKLWCCTPQMMVAATMVQDFCDRARLDNVIPELEYTQSDLMLYLYRGLASFNSLPPRVTSFTGTNMQGPFLESLVVMACTAALQAQYMAEGALSFDFSGQTVSLNMDRSPAIESTLGRLESELNSKVMPLRKLIGRAGVYSGDGSQGGRLLQGGSNFGRLSVSRNPLTRLQGNNTFAGYTQYNNIAYGVRRG